MPAGVIRKAGPPGGLAINLRRRKMKNHTVPARIALFLTLAAIALTGAPPLAAQTGSDFETKPERKRGVYSIP
jgi:hypothetical protein